jgi:hypothetical protein
MNSELPQLDETLSTEDLLDHVVAGRSAAASGRWAGQKLECGIHTFSKREQ